MDEGNGVIWRVELQSQKRSSGEPSKRIAYNAVVIAEGSAKCAPSNPAHCTPIEMAALVKTRVTLRNLRKKTLNRYQSTLEVGKHMATLKLLDLFCGAGGAAMGYYRAGFHDITGVDIVQQPRYPFKFIQGDALEFDLAGFDVIHASPPCQRFSAASAANRKTGKQYKDLLTPTRKKLKDHGGCWVIENVVGAPMERHLILCGLMFGLKVFRHRYFESSHILLQPDHPSHRGKRIGEGYYSIAGGAGRWKSWGKIYDHSRGTRNEWRAAMGIDWMTRKELTQAIPPAYTEFIGRQLIGQVR